MSFSAGKVIGSVFSGPNRDGDFSWMITQPQYERTLFVFNDNEEQFRAFLRGQPSGCTRGGGNAAIRPYQCTVPRRAAGIPTGSCGEGYELLSDDAKRNIDDAISEIRKLLKSGSYDVIIFSKDADSETLGTGIFRVGDDVKHYIYQSLMSL
jgi:hypothetical protein